MNRCLVALLLTVSVILDGCSSHQASPDDQAVLDAVLSQSCAQGKHGAVVLSTQPVLPDIDKQGQASGPGSLSLQMLKQLVDRTRATQRLPDISACAQLYVVDEQRLHTLMQTQVGKPTTVASGQAIALGDGTAFRATFPNARILVRVSMPAYAADGLQAVVYLTEECGGLCAHSGFIVLSRSSGTWRVVDRKLSWQS
ncbi:hypothetical protein [Dyella sp.]|uniref:hypothetical protein n=1 Tax=Dyella sp. TaxID=1869338 RepID=UPI002ED30FBE